MPTERQRAEAELREAIDALGDVLPGTGEIAGGLRDVTEWLEHGEHGLAFSDLVSIAEAMDSSEEVWSHLSKALRLMNLAADDPTYGRHVRAVDSRL